MASDAREREIALMEAEMIAATDAYFKARQNPDATDADFLRAEDGYVKRVFEEVDPVSEEALRTGNWTMPAAQGAEPVFLVATGEVYEGRETYTRHDGAPPPLCDFERLYTKPT